MTRRLLIFASLFSLACTVQAESRAVPDMYQFEQPVVDASDEARKLALSEAMQAALVRITGDRKIAERPQALTLVAQANGYVQRYGYAQRPPEIERSDHAPLPSDLAPTLVLQGRFDERALSAAIRKAGLPLWTARRPIVLALIAVNTPAGGQVLDSVSISAYPELLETANLRGLPLVLPEPGSLSYADMLPKNDAAIRRLAESMQAEYLLSSRLDEVSGKWVLEAELLPQLADAAPVAETAPEEPLFLEELQVPTTQAMPFTQPLQHWRLRSREPGPLLREVLHRAGDLIAGRHALAASTPGGESVVGLWVRGLKSGDDYMRIQRHLARLPVVQSLELVAVREGVLIFRVITEAGPEQLDSSIRQAGRLQTDSMPPAATASPIWTGEFEFHYRLR